MKIKILPLLVAMVLIAIGVNAQVKISDTPNSVNNPFIIKLIGSNTDDPCTFENPSNGFEDGHACSVSSGYHTANDLEVAADENFVLEQITAGIFIEPGLTLTNVDVYYYSNSGGYPGTQIGVEMSVVPTSQNIIGSNYGYDIREVVLDVTPFDFLGQYGAPTTYWIELNTEDTGGGWNYWEMRTGSVIGFPLAYKGGSWAYFDPGYDGCYVFAGECDPIADQYTVTFTVDDGVDPIEGAEILIDEETIYTDANGMAMIELIDGDYDYVITYAEYELECETYSSTLTVNGGPLDENVSMNCAYYYDITFHVEGNWGAGPLSGAIINVTDEYTDESYSGFTDANGDYTFEGDQKLHDGDWQYSITKSNYYQAEEIFNVSQTETINVELLSGISELGVAVQIYPNPAQGEFVIESYEASNAVITDITGKQVMNVELKQGKNSVSISTPGIYFVNISGINYKLVVE